MNLTHTLALLTDTEPIAWLVVLLALYFGGERRVRQLQKSGLGEARYDERPPSYRALGAFVSLQLLWSLASPILTGPTAPLDLSPHAVHLVYAAVYWTLYLLSTVTVLFVIGALIRNSLTPLPGLSAAALSVFRWTSALLLLIALTAHLPLFGVGDVWRWLEEVRVSCAVCVSSFELTLLGLLLWRLTRLGMCLRSRPIGLAFGLAALGGMELVSAATVHMAAPIMLWVQVLQGAVVLTVLLMWVYYVILPEPKRHAHSLSPGSRLMKWDEIARRLEMNGKHHAEQTPFISGVQLIVDGILDKYKIGGS